MSSIEDVKISFVLFNERFPSSSCFSLKQSSAKKMLLKEIVIIMMYTMLFKTESTPLNENFHTPRRNIRNVVFICFPNFHYKKGIIAIRKKVIKNHSIYCSAKHTKKGAQSSLLIAVTVSKFNFYWQLKFFLL